ncbi:hypothetical protein MRX96_013776 [Rhipicephalus microplus]
MEASPSAAGYTGARDMVMFGFDSKLDWLPTSFVNQFPEEKICSVCGLVPLGMHILSCGHWVCPECYCEVEKSQRCPLDKKTVVMKCFKRTTGSTKKLEKLKVRCWNAKYGCEVEGSVSEMLLHIKVMCRYHTIRCRRCHAVVLHRHIVPHLDSDCEGYRIAGEQSVRDEAADEIGATQAISKARFDPGAVRNTSAASKDIVLGSSSQHSKSTFSGITRRAKRKLEGADNAITTTASAPTVEQPASTSVDAVVTRTGTPAKKRLSGGLCQKVPPNVACPLLRLLRLA